MLYFSRVRLDRNAPAQAICALLEPDDASARMDAHHRLIWTLFPSASDQSRDFLWRADGSGQFFILSARPPQGHDLFCQPLETKEFAPNLSPGTRLTFTLRVNATKERPRSKLNSDGRNRRVDVAMHALKMTPGQHELADTQGSKRPDLRFKLATEAGQEWLVQQGKRNGFDLDDFVLEDYSTLSLLRGKKGRQSRGVKFGVLDMSGSLTVTDPDLFLAKVRLGFGRAKGFGCGLMLIRRA